MSNCENWFDFGLIKITCDNLDDSLNSYYSLHMGNKVECFESVSLNSAEKERLGYILLGILTPFLRIL